MDTNENILKITGRANIISPLSIGKIYDLTLSECECRKCEEIPTDDGKVDKIFSLRLSNLSEVNIRSKYHKRERNY